MKRIYILILLLMICMPIVVTAKESCSVVSGNGKEIGSEIVCGSEHFYIVKNNSNNLELLTKYNLYVGANYDKIKVDSSQIYEKIECRNSNCTDFNYNNEKYYFDGVEVANQREFLNKIKQKFGLDELNDMANLVGGNDNSALYMYSPIKKETEDGILYQYRSIKLYPYTLIETNTEGYAMQNELALGVTGEKGNANYPIYATFSFFPNEHQNASYILESQDEYLEGYINVEFKDSAYIIGYLNSYKNRLNTLGYEVSKVDMFNIKEINDLVHSISNKNLPLEDWFIASENGEGFNEDGIYYKNIGDLKEYLSNDYKWLWNTSYWMKTMANSTGSYAYFVSSSGEICYSSTSCGGIPRAGLRPVVTLDKSNIKYKIFTKTDGNGTIDVIDSAFGNDTIQFKATSKQGYKLKGITVTTDSGEKVEFREGEITNKNGIYSIDKNRFTMPFENVTIEARWGTDILNPNTGMFYSIVFIIILVIGISTYTFTKKKKVLE